MGVPMHIVCNYYNNSKTIFWFSICMQRVICYNNNNNNNYSKYNEIHLRILYYKQF